MEITVSDAGVCVNICGSYSVVGKLKYQGGMGWSIWHGNICIVADSVCCCCLEIIIVGARAGNAIHPK